MNLTIKAIFKNPVLKNFSVLTISSILVQGLSILSSIKIAKNLMPEGYGLYSFILSLSSIYVVIVSLGFRNTIIRSIAINKKDAATHFTLSFLIRAAVFVFAVIAIIVYNSFFSKVVLSGTYVFWLCVSVFALLHWDTVESITFGYEKMKFSAYVNLVMTVIWVIVIVIMPVEYVTVYVILVLTVVFQILKAIFLTLFAYKERMIAFGKMPGRIQVIARIKEAFPFYVLAIFTLFTSQLPVIYLEHMSTYEEIAYFNVSNRLIYPLELLLITLLTSLFPALSRNHEHNKERFSQTINITFIAIFCLGVLGAFTASTFRNEIVNMLYGSKYAETADVIAIQCWFTVLFGVFCLIGTILSATHKQYLLSKLSIAYAVISFPCLVYGAKFGAVGLSVGFVLAGLLNMTYHIYFLQRSIPKRISAKYIYAAFLVYSLFFVTSWLIVRLDLIVRVGIFFLFMCIIATAGYKFWLIQKKKGGLFAN